jgi:hypothetical protein
MASGASVTILFTDIVGPTEVFVRSLRRRRGPSDTDLRTRRQEPSTTTAPQ